MAETDMFLKLDGIEGESLDHKFNNWIEVQSWNWGVHQAGTAQRGTGSGHSKASFQELHISKHIDKATAKLWKACSTGEHIKKGKLVCRKAGGEAALEYFTIEMEDVLITNVGNSGHGAGAAPVSDTVALSIGKFKMTYKPQSDKGTAEGGIDFGYDIKKNQPA